MEWVTTTQILNDLKFSGNTAAWATFTEHFYPIITAFARKSGLNPADAEDAAQETVVTFLNLYRSNKYQRQKGQLSHWLFGVARNVIRDYHKKKPREYQVGHSRTQTSFFASIQDENAVLHTWETEWRRMTLQRCLVRACSQVDEKTCRAFEMYALQQQPVEQVCEKLQMTANAVYIAKNRVLNKIRQLQQEYDD